MAELGIIASVVQIADAGLRLSIKLYTFGEIVASADRSVISISKDVSLTSGVLKELGQILDKDRGSRIFSENAVQTADGVVKECLEVFQEMENILVKKLPSLAGKGKEGRGGERAKRATILLERLKWGYLQPKLQLLRSNLDRLKSTLLLMLNVITYTRQVSEKTESPSVIAEQRSLIEDLADSNQEYIRKFEKLKLGVEGPAVGHVDDAPIIGAGRREPSITSRSPSEAPGHASKRTRFTVGEAPLVPLQDEGIVPHFGPDINNVFISTGAQTNIEMPPIQERGIPRTEAPMGFHQEVLFKQLEHYSMLIKNLLKEVDEAQYKITFKSRLRMKGGIASLHEGERQELEKVWGGTALQSAEQRLDSLTEGYRELPRMHRVAARDPVEVFEAAAWSPQSMSFKALSTSTIKDISQTPILINEAPAKKASVADVSENDSDRMTKAYTRHGSEQESGGYLSDGKYAKSTIAPLSASMGGPRKVEPKTRASHVITSSDMKPPGKTVETLRDAKGLEVGPSVADGITRAQQEATADSKNEQSQFELDMGPEPIEEEPGSKTALSSVRKCGYLKKRRRTTASAPPAPPNSASEAEPPTPTPATPIMPQYSATSAPVNRDGQDLIHAMPDMTSAAADQLAPPQQDTAMPDFEGYGEGVDASQRMSFNSDLSNPDVIENFDFERFMQMTDQDFKFDGEDEIGGSISYDQASTLCTSWTAPLPPQPEVGDSHSHGGPRQHRRKDSHSLHGRDFHADAHVYGRAGLNPKPGPDPDLSSHPDDSLEWPLDRVLTWLATNGFSNDWQKTFESFEISGPGFLDLGRGKRGRGNSIPMHQVIYSSLAGLCAERGTDWDQVKEREEGRRMRRLIRDIDLERLPRRRVESTSFLDAKLDTPSLQPGRPVSLCQRCRSAELRCDGKVPACTACEVAMQSAECSYVSGSNRELQVMETSKRILGEEHPDTLTNMANLASTYRNQGRWKEAEELEVQVMDVRKRVLGEEHTPRRLDLSGVLPTKPKEKTSIEWCSKGFRACLKRKAPSTNGDHIPFSDDTYNARASETRHSPSASSVVPSCHSYPPQRGYVSAIANEQSDLRFADMEVVDRLVSLWTTVKPL